MWQSESLYLRLQARFMPLTGTLRTWNDDRGFGFIAPTHGGAEIFVHISAFPRDGSQPTAGETLTYELGRGQNGKPQAVKAWRTAVGRDAHTALKTTRPPRRQHRSAMMIISVLLLGAVGIYGYGRFEKRLGASGIAAPTVAGQSEATDGAAINAAQFSCDGRVYCSQMTSCTEAKFFLKNCPGTKMDGNNDGVPCQEQWCAGPFAK